MQTIYLWKLEKTEYGDPALTKVISWGATNQFIEMFVCEIIPECNSSSDRNLNRIQNYIDEHYPDRGYTFSYKEIEVDLEGWGDAE